MDDSRRLVSEVCYQTVDIGRLISKASKADNRRIISGYYQKAEISRLVLVD